MKREINNLKILLKGLNRLWWNVIIICLIMVIILLLYWLFFNNCIWFMQFEVITCDNINKDILLKYFSQEEILNIKTLKDFEREMEKVSLIIIDRKLDEYIDNLKINEDNNKIVFDILYEVRLVREELFKILGDDVKENISNMYIKNQQNEFENNCKRVLFKEVEFLQKEGLQLFEKKK